MSSENRRLGSPVPHKEEKKSRKKKDNDSSLRAEILSWVQILLTAACIAFVLNTFIIANSRIPSGSMENTIMTNDRVIGSRLTYRFSDPQRGDIAIFHFPDDESIYYVKRIIGLPGDVIDIKDGAVYLNGSDTPLEEPYLREPMLPEDDLHFEVPEDSYFMMGDNRNFSFDARYWTNTFVKRDKIIAKVLVRYWPLNKMGTVQ
ncbi:MAG: signal peptidase I [Lachnospiraceae bacterium]|nr:signal peptidase I [Lachnospiraceae bacterium]